MVYVGLEGQEFCEFNPIIPNIQFKELLRNFNLKKEKTCRRARPLFNSANRNIHNPVRQHCPDHQVFPLLVLIPGKNGKRYYRVDDSIKMTQWGR